MSDLAQRWEQHIAEVTEIRREVNRNQLLALADEEWLAESEALDRLVSVDMETRLDDPMLRLVLNRLPDPSRLGDMPEIPPESAEAKRVLTTLLRQMVVELGNPEGRERLVKVKDVTSDEFRLPVFASKSSDPDVFERLLAQSINTSVRHPDSPKTEFGALAVAPDDQGWASLQACVDLVAKTSSAHLLNFVHLLVPIGPEPESTERLRIAGSSSPANPGMMLINSNLLPEDASVGILAGHVVHEACHSRIYDLVKARITEWPREDETQIVPPWHTSGPREGWKWTTNRTLVAFDVYVELTSLQLEAYGASSRSDDPSYEEASSRAEYLGAELVTTFKDHLPDSLRDFVDWRQETFDSL